LALTQFKLAKPEAALPGPPAGPALGERGTWTARRSREAVGPDEKVKRWGMSMEMQWDTRHDKGESLGEALGDVDGGAVGPDHGKSLGEALGLLEGEAVGPDDGKSMASHSEAEALGLLDKEAAGPDEEKAWRWGMSKTC
jgi:hypothetical protein